MTMAYFTSFSTRRAHSVNFLLWFYIVGMGYFSRRKARRKEAKARRKEAIAARSDEENMGRLKFVRYLAIFIVVVGLPYFLIREFTKDKPGDKVGGDINFDDYMVRNCFGSEYACDEPCNGTAKNTAGKYCCKTQC